MKSLFILAGLFSLALFAGTTNARKHPGEYWQDGLKDKPKPELITQGHVDVSKEDKLFTNEFKTRTSFWVYNDEPKSEEKSFRKEFETKPNLWVYSDDSKPIDETLTLFTKEFERKSSFWVYNDENAKQREEKPFRKGFETKPNLWVYSDDAKPRNEDLFIKEFGGKAQFSMMRV